MDPRTGYIISGSYDKTVRIWNADTGECVRTLEGHSHVSFGTLEFLLYDEMII